MTDEIDIFNDNSSSDDDVEALSRLETSGAAASVEEMAGVSDNEAPGSSTVVAAGAGNWVAGAGGSVDCVTESRGSAMRVKRCSIGDDVAGSVAKT